MRGVFTSLLVVPVLVVTSMATAQSGNLSVPRSVPAGSAFSIATTGSGKATLTIIGPGQALRRDVQLGETTAFPAGVLYNAGRYLVLLTVGASTTSEDLDVTPASQPETLSFLAKPSRLPVGLHDGISGTVYVFDAYRNLILTPMPISFELSNQSGTQGKAVTSRTVTTRNGVAWTRMDSSTKEGSAKFVAQVDGISSARVIEQVPGDPCSLTISARANGNRVQLQTAPVRDCSGNPVPDGTIVTFTETYDGMQSTVDVPIKQGIAQVEMPNREGARISVASGVVAGNEIRWSGGR